MKIKMLPNWCKKVGLVVFLIGAIVSGYKGFMDGFTAECNLWKEYDDGWFEWRLYC